MTCDQTQPLLEALIDRELNWGTAWRVRRHLAECPACASELVDSQRLSSRVHAWRDVSAPAGLGERIAAALPPIMPASRQPRRVRVMRRAAVGLAGMTAAAAAFFWLLPGHPGQPTIAFADVEQAMQQVQTISYQVEEHVNGPKSKETQLTFTYWVRRNPPAIALTDFQVTPALPGFEPVKNLIDTRGGFTLTRDHCDVISPLKVSAQQRVKRQIHDLTQLPEATPTVVSRDQAQITTTNFEQREVVVNGQNQIRFDRDVKTVGTTSNAQSLSHFSHVITWADAKTHRIIRIETRTLRDSSPQIALPLLLVMDHFQYDQTPPEGTFDWSPPTTGTKIIRLPLPPVKNLQSQSSSFPSSSAVKPVHMTFYYWASVADQKYPNRPIQMSITRDSRTGQEHYTFFDRHTQQRFRDGAQIKAEMRTAKTPGQRHLLQQELRRWQNFLKHSPVVLTEAEIEPNVRAEISENGPYNTLSIEFTAQGKQKFSRFTTAHVGEINGIVSKDSVLSAPYIMEPIVDGEAQISGGFANLHEAQVMAAGLNAAVEKRHKP